MPRLLKYLLIMIIWSSVVDADDRILSLCEIKGQWTEGTIDANITQEGNGSLLWAHSETEQIALRLQPLDLRTHKSMRFHIHNALSYLIEQMNCLQVL